MAVKLMKMLSGLQSNKLNYILNTQCIFVGNFEYERNNRMLRYRILRRCHSCNCSDILFINVLILSNAYNLTIIIMKLRTLQRQIIPQTPISKAKIRAVKQKQKRETTETCHEQPSLRTKTYSFQDKPQEKLNQFCNQVQQIYTLLNIGKRITDPNVIMLNSTQKEIVEMIIDNNKNSQDQKSMYLTQRAGKYIKLLWKSQKFNDMLMQPSVKVEKSQPHYASPIRNFKKTKITTDKSLSHFSSNTDRSISKNRPNKLEKQEKNGSKQATSRTKRINSEDHKFSNVRINKFDEKRKKSQKQKQKSFEVDLTKNVAWKTMNTTKNFENMLKILKKQA